MSKTSSSLSTLSGLIDSDSELELMDNNVILAPEIPLKNKKQGRKGKKTLTNTKVTNTKTAPRRMSGRLNKSRKKIPLKTVRKALADKTNEVVSDTEDFDYLEKDAHTMMDVLKSGDELDSVSITTAQDIQPPTTKMISRSGTNKQQVCSKTTSLNTDITMLNEKNTVSLAKHGSQRMSLLNSIYEPQEATQHDYVHESDGVNCVASQSSQYDHGSRAASQPRQQYHNSRTVENERPDPAMRRKLGELTNKFESLNVKYQDLRDIGLRDAERNFERLKKQSEEKTNVANKLIASLKADIVSQSILRGEVQELEKTTEDQNAELISLRTRLSEISKSLADVQSENTSLIAKLTANRNISTSIGNAGAKPSGGTSTTDGNIGTRINRNAESAQIMQVSQMKENLYGDLTGLIIRGVKHDEEEDVFDCIQTGRNGTLHFKLCIGTDAGLMYEDTQCVYVPQLDPNRDKPLLELLPDYLTEEITFPRQQAAKFYARVIKALTEKSI